MKTEFKRFQINYKFKDSDLKNYGYVGNFKTIEEADEYFKNKINKNNKYKLISIEEIK